MNLRAWLAYIEECHPENIEMGLSRVRAVAEKACLMHFDCPVILVAGTNGKGSTVLALATLLRAAGYRVGTYTSPHLIAFNERIQYQGHSVSDQALCEAFDWVEQHRDNIPLTFFEFTTLAAFYFLQAQQPDWVVLEIGLGGRQDAVNIIDPVLSIITTISLDHQAYLGTTREAIGFEKAGIIRRGCPVILGSQAQTKSILAVSQAQAAPCYLALQDFGYCAPDLPAESVSLAVTAYTVMSRNPVFKLPALERVSESLRDLRLPGRFYRLESMQGIEIIADVGHNPEASSWLSGKLRELSPQKRIIAVWASMADKDLASIVSPLIAQVSMWCVAAIPGVPRAASVCQLANVLEAAGVREIFRDASVSAAFHRALAKATQEDLVLVFGSFYTVAALLIEIGEK